LASISKQEDSRLDSLMDGVPNTTRTNDFDLKNLLGRVEELFSWYQSNEKKEVAPYFPIVQSSGTGKTKLVYDLKRVLVDTIDVILISSVTRIDTEIKHYDFELEQSLFQDAERDSNRLKTICLNLNQILDKKLIQWEKEKRILVFDEAQNLASANGGFLVRCLRWYLRRKRQNVQTVAILLGTSGSIADLFPETDEVTLVSRVGSPKRDDPRYHSSGSLLFPPFIDLWTVGSLASRITFGGNATDYEKAIPYGRPLFARMLVSSNITINDTEVEADASISEADHTRILHKLLISPESGEDLSANKLAHLSVLATRVQLGGVPVNVVSTLVARGYSHLIYFRQNGQFGDCAHFAQLPDPVCARLSMAMMEENFAQTALAETQRRGVEPNRIPPVVGPFYGVAKAKWVDYLGSLLSLNLCRPPRGDLGETLSALYMLFCGDELRFEADRSFQTFSISLERWLQKLNPSAHEGNDMSTKPLFSSERTTDGEDVMSIETLVDGRPGEYKDSENGIEDMQTHDASVPKGKFTMSDNSSSASISFIQFCRNHLRLDPPNMFNQDLLAQLYYSGTIMYPHEYYEAVDAIGSVKVEGRFYPLVVSIKTMAKPPDLKAVVSMISLLRSAKVTSAICILLMLDPDKDRPIHFRQPVRRSNRQSFLEGKESDHQLALDALNSPVSAIGTKYVARIIPIPKDDKYGISTLAASFTRCGNERAEIFQSHPMLPNSKVQSIQDAMRRKKGDFSASLANMDDRCRKVLENIDNEFLKTKKE